MKNGILSLLLMMTTLVSCQSADTAQESHDEEEQEQTHWDPTQNFTVMRMIILNDQNEMLVLNDQGVWATPSLVFQSRQYLSEGLDSLVAEFGIEIDQPQLHGYFGYKYEYHPYATMRSYFVANHVSGDLKLPKDLKEVKWLPVAEAVDIQTVKSIKQIIKQIIGNPGTVWGGSFMVYRDGKAHPTEMVEPFYPLFESKN